jgi:hypothetical protein
MNKSLREQLAQHKPPRIYTLRVVATGAFGRIGFVVEDTAPDAYAAQPRPGLTIESVTVLGSRPLTPPPPPPPAPRDPMAPRLVRRA